MKNFLILLFLLALLPCFASAQINWNQVFGKQRFQQGLGLPSTDTANFRTTVDTSAIVLNRADSTVYFRYKGKWRTLASGGAGSTPNLQQVLTQGASAYNNLITLYDTSIPLYSSRFEFAFNNFAQENYMQISRDDGTNYGRYGNEKAFIDFQDYGAGITRSISIGRNKTGSNFDNFMSLQFSSSGTINKHKLRSASNFLVDSFTTIIPAKRGYLAMSVNNTNADANGNITISTTTDTASLSNRIDNKQTDLDLLRLMGYTIKAEPYGVTLAQMANQLLLTSNQIAFYPFYWNVSDTLRGVSWFNRSASTSNQSNYNGIGIYSLSGGTLTRLTFTANDTTFWDCSANTWSSKSITPYFLAKGLYFFGYQFSGTGGTAPTIGSGDPLVIAGAGGPAFPPTEVNPNGVRFSTFITNATTTPPSSVAMSATSFRVGIPYFLFY